jgi:hypothetical protein
MDQPSRPTAEELGISDVEYDRILRDMRRRGQGDAAVSSPPHVAPGEPVPGSARPRPSRGLRLAALGVIAVVVLMIRLGATDHGPAYAFMKTVDGHPVTYSSCRPIQVAIYPAGGPPDAEALVREAVAEMRSATGLDVVVAGVFGGHAPNWNFEDGPVYPDDPISVSWQDGDAIADMTDHIAGLGGSRVTTGPHGSERLVAGTVALSRDYYRLLTEHRDHDEALAVLLHEFGHVFGLAHVDSPGELMYKKNLHRTTFGPGDLEGLRLLGQGPCT